jgi:hypothetical protein
MSQEIDRVLAMAPVLKRTLGRFWAVPVLLFALWIMKPRTGIVGLLVTIGLAIVGWFRLRA